MVKMIANGRFPGLQIFGTNHRFKTVRPESSENYGQSAEE